ncbi:MAG: hypothetical protein M3142_10660 [Bacteroidota bacterium]|nr:hypothetical protein [Bacteroidota bacterium]
MLLYSGIITLDYNPATDVLVTSMPDVRQFGMSEVSFCLNLIVENIRNYHIKNLLLDSSKSVIEVDDEVYKSITMRFGMELMSTNLKKLARVGTYDKKREEKSARISGELRQELQLPIEFKNFSTPSEAMEWLVPSE